MEKYKNPQLTIEERAENLLSLMTLEEKAAQMDMIRGVELATKVHEAHFCAVDETSDFYWDQADKQIGKKGIGFVHDVYSTPEVLNKLQRYFVEKTRLGIPCIFTGEALHGISWPGATVFPMPINLGAAFDPELTRQQGHAIAAETRSLGIHEILAPNLDLAREPRWGRVEETFGEDTYLSSQMAYAIVTGEQGTDMRAEDAVAAEPKHYCVHGIPEGGINCSPARVGKREIETVYMPVFEAGIKKAGACNAMASYNSIDGEAVICSEYYLREILKTRFGLKGYVRADFGAVSRLWKTHHLTGSDAESIARAVNGGLDVQGFDFPNEVWEQSLIDLVHEGKIAMQVIDEAVLRILRVKFALGLFEHPYTDEKKYRSVIRCEEHKAIALRGAEESIVMLKNEGSLLPLSREVTSIALIGPSSGRQRIGSYSSVPYGYTVRSLSDEIADIVGENCRIRQADGCGVTDQDVELIPRNWFPNGIHLEYYDNDSFSGEPVGTGEANQVKFNWILAKPHRNLNFKGYSVRMRANMKVHTGDFTDSDQLDGKLVFTTGDSVRILIDGICVIDSVGDHKQALPSCPFTFVNGREHDVVIEYVCDVNGNDLKFCVDHHGDSMEQAVQAARESDVVILVCGDNTVTSGEGMDRCDLKLYGKQRELIEKVSKLGKKTVLVLENGKPVDLSEETEWADSILVAWFGGEFGAKAIANVLFGEVNPSGRLPISFPKGVGYLPCYYAALPGGAPSYLEGERKELFEFGYGLSYTQFRYSDLQIEKGINKEDLTPVQTADETDVLCADDRYRYTVSVRVKNVGTAAGDEVVQLYINDVASSIVTPEKLLQGFKRISLQPGEEKCVKFALNFNSFRLFNLSCEWVVEPGEFEIMAGASSRDIRLKGRIVIE